MRGALIALALSACGHKSSTSPIPPEDIGTVNVTSSNQTLTASDTGTWNLNVDGSGNTVTVAADSKLNLVTLSGTGNDLAIGPSSSVAGSVTLDGVSCTLHLPVGSPVVVHVSGTDNHVVYDSSVG